MKARLELEIMDLKDDIKELQEELERDQDPEAMAVLQEEISVSRIIAEYVELVRRPSRRDGT